MAPGMGMAVNPAPATGADPNSPDLNQLPPDLESALDEMVRRQMYIDAETDKVLQYAQMRKCLLYWNGKQWLKPIVNGNGDITDYTSIPVVGSPMSTRVDDLSTRGRYDTVENFVRGDGNKFCAVLGEKSPNPKAQALDPQSPNAEGRAKLADRILLCLRRLWNVEEVHRLLVLSAWRDGTFFLHTPWESDVEKYGTVVRQKEIFEAHVAYSYRCMQCGYMETMQVPNPQQTQPQPGQNPPGNPLGQPPPPMPGQPGQQSPPSPGPSPGPPPPPPGLLCPNCHMGQLAPTEAQELLIPKIVEERNPGAAPGCYDASFYEVTMPFYVDVLGFERTPWFIWENEEHRGELLEQYPQLWDRIHDDVETNEWPDNTVSQTGYWSRNMRANVNSDLRQTSRYRWIKAKIWLRPTQYNMFGKKTMRIPGSSNEVEIRSWFKQRFPGGCKITRVGRWIVDIESEKVAHHWSVGVPMISKNVYCDPVVLDFLQIQDAINSADNLFQENMERNIPLTLANQNLINVDALRSRPGVPGEILGVDMEQSGSLKDAMYNLPVSQLDGQNFGYREKMLETGREITGVTKAIFGASNASTAHEAELQKTQAMLQLGLVWKGLQNCWRGAYTNGLRSLAQFGADVLMKWGLSQDDVDAAASLVDEHGNLNGIRVSVEEGIPATWGQIRDAVMFIMQQGPPSWQLSGLSHPGNAAAIQDALGISNWITPGGTAKDYVLKLVKRLLAGHVNPQIGPDGRPMIGPDGMPLPPSPSEQIDPLILPVGLGMPLLQEWCLGNEGQQAAQDNPEGFGNLHLAIEIYSAPPPMPPGPDGKPVDQGGDGDSGDSANAGPPGLRPPPGHQPGGPGPTAPAPHPISGDHGRLQMVANQGKR